MRPGLLVQHSRLPDRVTTMVRCDIAGIIGFLTPDRWPEDAETGDFIELHLRRSQDLWNHPDRQLFDEATQAGVKHFFLNGGDRAHLFGVCISSEDDLKFPEPMMGSMASLLDRLRAEEDIGLLFVPSAAHLRCQIEASGAVAADVDNLYDMLLAHCREMNNRFLVMDAPHGLHEEHLERWVRAFRGRSPETRCYGAIYYPWLHEGDQIYPPSGAVAGTYARVEIEHGTFGVIWPPANVPLRGITHLEVELTWSEASAYAEQAINPIVIQSGRGILIFGARTLSTEKQFQYINTRRIVNMIFEQLRRDSAWAVFEVNNPNLWDILDRDIRHRLSEFSGAGLLTTTGEEPDYTVACDEGTNPIALRDAGMVNVEVMLRPVGTTEQVLIDLCIGDNA